MQLILVGKLNDVQCVVSNLLCCRWRVFCIEWSLYTAPFISTSTQHWKGIIWPLLSQRPDAKKTFPLCLNNSSPKIILQTTKVAHWNWTCFFLFLACVTYLCSLDTLMMVMALKDLATSTRRLRTALWCALQMVLPKPVGSQDQATGTARCPSPYDGGSFKL